MLAASRCCDILDTQVRLHWWPAPQLVHRFHETDQIGRIEINPTNLVLRSRAKRGVSKDGRRHDTRLGPSFETRARERAPQDEADGVCRYDSNLGNAVLDYPRPARIFREAICLLRDTKSRAPGDGHSRRKRTMWMVRFKYTRSPGLDTRAPPLKKVMPCCEEQRVRRSSSALLR